VLRNLSGATLTAQGAAEIDVLFENDGNFVLGQSPGFLTVRQWTQGPSGVLYIELGETFPDTYDVLAVTGGRLDSQLSELGGGEFIPDLNDSFRILTATIDIEGEFANVHWPALASGLHWGIRYTHHEVFVDVLAASLPGDFDLDGDVDGRDFLKWQRGESPNSLCVSDLTEWQANYGAIAPLMATSTLVPEPLTWAALLMGLTAILICREQKLEDPR